MLPVGLNGEESFLASDGNFHFIQRLHSKNRIIPVVGDFAGTTAIQGIGEYAREHHDLVQAFYGSNVNVYLTNQQKYAFCRNLESLPVSSSTVFIDNDGARLLAMRLRACPSKAQ